MVAVRSCVKVKEEEEEEVGMERSVCEGIEWSFNEFRLS